MCWECGGRCLLCGEPSTKVIVGPCGIEKMSCDEHVDEVKAKADSELVMRLAAPWN